MVLGLTSEQKISLLTTLKAAMSGEIYTLLSRCGLDPDTYDPEIGGVEPFNGELIRARSMIESLELMESKIAELS